MAVAFVQGKFAFVDGAASTQAVTFTSNVAAGNCIVCFFKCAYTASGNISVADNLGNTYTLIDTAANNGSTDRLSTFYAKNIAGGSCTVTATFTGSSGYPRLLAHEYSGADTTSSVINAHDIKAQLNPGSGTDALTSAGTAATTVNGCMIVGFTIDHSGISTLGLAAGTGFTGRTAGATPANNYDSLNSESLIQSSSGSAAATFSAGTSGSSQNFTTAMVALAPAAASSATTQSHGFVAG